MSIGFFNNLKKALYQPNTANNQIYRVWRIFSLANLQSKVLTYTNSDPLITRFTYPCKTTLSSGPKCVNQKKCTPYFRIAESSNWKYRISCYDFTIHFASKLKKIEHGQFILWSTPFFFYRSPWNSLCCAADINIMKFPLFP